MKVDKKTDWFYKNEQFDRKMDDRADKNNYRTLQFIEVDQNYINKKAHICTLLGRCEFFQYIWQNHVCGFVIIKK